MKAMLGQFYLDRADECRKAAASSPLANVQRKHRQAEASWRAMADVIAVRHKATEAE